jgi:hypothetical protein
MKIERVVQRRMRLINSISLDVLSYWSFCAQFSTVLIVKWGYIEAPVFREKLQAARRHIVAHWL